MTQSHITALSRHPAHKNECMELRVGLYCSGLSWFAMSHSILCKFLWPLLSHCVVTFGFVVCRLQERKKIPTIPIYFWDFSWGMATWLPLESEFWAEAVNVTSGRKATCEITCWYRDAVLSQDIKDSSVGASPGSVADLRWLINQSLLF